jgi:hypothetical protein
LTGIQISTATNIAGQVASGELTRDQAIALLQTFFGLSRDGAEAIVGSSRPSINMPPPPPPPEDLATPDEEPTP